MLIGRRRKKRTFSPSAYRLMRLILVPLLRLYHRPAVIDRRLTGFLRFTAQPPGGGE